MSDDNKTTAERLVELRARVTRLEFLYGIPEDDEAVTD